MGLNEFYARHHRAIALALAGLALVVFCCLLIEVASADLVYSANFTPKNNLLESRVKQGDTIYLGKTYDFSGVTGFSYEYAWWSDWKEENANCNPDKVIDIRYWKTLQEENAIYLDPKIWKEGNWYYWDGYECNISHYNIDTHEWESTGLREADNKFAFIVKRQEKVIVPEIPPETETIPPYASAYESPTISKVSVAATTAAVNETPKTEPGKYSPTMHDTIKYFLLAVILIGGGYLWFSRE